MIDLNQHPRIPIYGSPEHKEWLVRRIRRNLRHRRLYGIPELRPAVAERER